MAFYGPQPAGIKIERSVDNAMRFEPWQYFAEDCVTAFGLDNNGGLPEPDSVNCIQYEQYVAAIEPGILFDYLCSFCAPVHLFVQLCVT